MAEKLSHLKSKKTVVLGIPRGGVVVAAEVAKKLGAPLDLIVTKKIGAPDQPELAIGAVGPAGTRVIDEKLARQTGVDDEYLNREGRLKVAEIIRLMKQLRGRKKAISLKGKTAIVVDDGVATGATVEAALRYLAGQKPAKIILAVPVGAPDSMEKLAPLADEVACLERPPYFAAVGQFYRDFPPVTDEEVRKTLEQFRPQT